MSDAREFVIKEGVTVMLKSGGPPMTVSSRVDMTNWACLWFDEGNKLNYGAFPAATLKEYAR